MTSLFSSADFQQFIDGALAALLGLGIAAMRTLGVALVFPVFTKAELGGILRIGFALALGLPVMWHATESIAALGSHQSARLVLIAMKELMVGSLIGFLFGVPFWAVQAVGELIDQQRGVTNEDATDPATRSQASSLSVFLGISAIAVFVAADGMRILTGTLYDSYAIWPLMSFMPKLTLDSALSIAKTLDHILSYALLVGGPVIALFLLLDLSVMLISRSAPQLNAYDLPPTLKNVVFVVFIGIYATYLMDYMRGELAGAHGIKSQIERFLQ
ncbi:type III secretion system export apparatus subunit SctT [Bradyrhizobium sp. WSM 1738]|uniref:type III secretion system export apparatus subunit SctT n=1 Tax=Bradyrhizobium hereditatis TaxID=2821405 RepID=UPI001CE2DCC8|nr:type III secretion system export apparatus subunit SctT [Bradyrhizobium hereditatis]MCA6116455.1 type III secretion system export apparatus subunit SctT [Bradyrhizobium hereditatis]